MTNREIIQMQTDIFVQLTYVAGFGNFIMQHSRANKGKLAACITRMELWVSRVNEFYTRGYAMAKLDQKQKWALGATDRHCGSCVKLNGKVKRASQWIDANIYPKSPELACNGYHCQCTLDPKTEPMSKGKLPKLP